MAMTLPRPEAAALSWTDAWAFVRGRPPLVWLACGFMVLALQIVSSLWYPTVDASRYLSIARSVTRGPAAANLGSPHLTYGVGYPFLISPLFLCDRYPFFLVTIVNAVFAAFYLAGAYVWIRRHAPRGALPLALLAVANTIVLTNFRRPLSEAAFMAALLWTVNALSDLPEARLRWRRLAATVLLLSCLALIRQAGILLVGGFGLHLVILALRGKTTWARAALLGLAMAVPPTAALGAMLAYDREMAARAGDWTNLDIFTRSGNAQIAECPHRPLLEQCVEGVRLRTSEVGRLLIPGMFNAYGGPGNWLNVNLFVYLPVCGLVLFGWWRLARRLDVFALTAPFYVGLYIYWPFDQSGRYLAPLLPLLLVGLWRALARLGRKRLRLAAGLLVLHLSAALGYWLVIDRPRALAAAERWPQAAQLARVIRGDPGPVEVDADLGKMHFLLEYELDRPVTWRQPGQPIAAGARWLVTTTAQRVEPGFRPVADVGGYRLWRHEQLQAGASSARNGRPPPAFLS
jgi:hypothetical protein